MFRDFAPKMDPCLGILLQKQAFFFLIFRKFKKKWTRVQGFWGQKWDPCLGIFCQKPTHLGGTSPYSVSMGVPPPPGIQAWKFSAFPTADFRFLCLPRYFFFTLKTRVFIAIAKRTKNRNVGPTKLRKTNIKIGKYYIAQD